MVLQNYLTESAVRIRDEVGSNVRLKRMLWVIACLAFVYIIFEFVDMIDAEQAEVDSLARKVASIESIGALSLWQARAQEQAKRRDELLTHCWPATSDGLASADLQTNIRTLLNRHGVTNARFNIAPAEQLGTDSWRIRAEITGKVKKEDLVPLLHDIENADNRLSIERASITFLRRDDTLNVLVTGCFSAVNV